MEVDDDDDEDNGDMMEVGDGWLSCHGYPDDQNDNNKHSLYSLENVKNVTNKYLVN